MTEAITNVFYLVAAGVILLTGVFVLRFVLKLAWKIVRTILMIASLLLIAGYFFGFLDIVIR